MSRKSITEPVVRVKELDREAHRLTLEIEFYPLDEPSTFRHTRVNYYATIGGREIQMGVWHGYIEIACSKPWPSRGPGKRIISSRAEAKRSNCGRARFYWRDRYANNGSCGRSALAAKGCDPVPCEAMCGP